MTNLPAALRQQLESTYDFAALKLTKLQGSADTTRKLLWELRSGDYIESVLIPASLDLFGERSDRFTLCVSTQVGCAYGCKFCASGLEGWKAQSNRRGNRRANHGDGTRHQNADQ